MGKVRVHELAKKLHMSNQELITKLNAKGLMVRTHSSSVDEQEAMNLLAGGDDRSARPGTSGSLRPRTVLRRRSEEVKEEPASIKEEEPESFKESIQEVVAPSFEYQKEPLENNSPIENEIPFKNVAPKIETPIAEEVPAEVPVPFTREQPPVIPSEKPIVESAPVAAPATVVEKAPSNVVRVINADAIKARLASEGRSFGRRGPPQSARPPYQPSGGHGGAGPRPGGPPSHVREYRVNQPRPGQGSGFGQGPSGGGGGFGGGMSGGGGGGGGYPSMGGSEQTRGGGARPSKRKKGSVSYGRDKESMSGGQELWYASGKKKKGHGDIRSKGPVPTQAAAHKRIIEINNAISVSDLAHKMSVKASQVVSKLMGMGMMVTVNQAVDFESAAIVASEFGFEVKNVEVMETDLIKEQADEEASLAPRAPIVTVMGHVDHGKTSVLDALRKSSVVSGEAGGITQHIGAYSVKTKLGDVTFLDTPGHEAFTSMRARGAQVTDIVVLVVAADDGVMPQTKEAIDHAKAAKAPVVVAINKMDLPEAKPERVMQQLADLGLIPEEWGGDTQYFKISALKKTGLDELVEGLVVLAEMMELRANPNKPASGCVIEAKLDKGRGPVATIMPQTGTLKLGDYIVAGETMGRVRAMYDSSGAKVKEAGPSVPVQVLGLSSVPDAGDRVNAMPDDKSAKMVASHRTQKAREHELLKTKPVSLETFLAQAKEKEDGVKSLRLIIKADVFGSAEALTAALKNLSTKEVKVEVVHSGVGTITESNVNLAMASNAIIIGFNIKADGKAQALAQQEKVDVRYYSVIYDAIDEVRAAMAGLLAPVLEERYLGKAEVRMIISVSKHGKIAGSYVLDGKIQRSGKVRVKRKNVELFVGNISGLKRFKDDVKEVGSGYECGISVDGFNDLQEGDILECFELKQVEAKLSEAISIEEKASAQNAQ